MKKIKSKLMFAKISPTKIRRLVNNIRNTMLMDSIRLLSFNKNKSSIILKDFLLSSSSNAEHNFGAKPKLLFISSILVDSGPTAKRFKARAKGRGNRIIKRTSHISLEIIETTIIGE